MRSRARDVRFWHKADIFASYSITSSARACSGGGTVSPSVLAVLILITSSYLVGPARQSFCKFYQMRVRQKGSMSALGHKRTFAVRNAMSALPPKADMCAASRDVRFVPIRTLCLKKKPPRGGLSNFNLRSHAMFFNRDACCASTRARAFFPSLAASVMVS